MMKTYKAMQIKEPGVLELVNKPIPTPDQTQVLLQVEACGMCGADIADIEKHTNVHRTPGHEVVGRIIAIGDAKQSQWELGQRVGVGRLAGHCNQCTSCRQGKFQHCLNQEVVGATIDGGYAEMMLAPLSGLVEIPDELESNEAAPILCAGLATFNALKKCGAEPGDTVVVLGVGGLGHMAIQYARNMGYRVVAIGRGEDIRKTVTKLGAHHYIDTNQEDIKLALSKFNNVSAAVATINHRDSVRQLSECMAPNSRLMILGVGKENVEVGSGVLVSKELNLQGSITGTPFENEKALQFSALTDSKPWIETVALEQANQAYQKMKAGDAFFRMVINLSDRNISETNDIG